MLIPPPSWHPVSMLHRPRPIKTLPTARAPRILLVQVAGIGDLVLATPAIQALRDRYPDAVLDLLTSPRCAGLLEGHPAIQAIYPFDIGSFRNPVRLADPAILARLRQQVEPVRDGCYDALISLNNVASTRGGITLGLLLHWFDVPLWVGRNTEGRAPYFDRVWREHLGSGTHEVRVKLRLAGLLNASIESRPLDLAITDGERDAVRGRLPSRGRVAALLPGKQDPSRAWPLASFEQVGRRLLEAGWAVVVLGGDQEGGVLRAQDLNPDIRVTNLAGRLELRETAAVLSYCELAVAADTGPMHMAAAMNVPLVTVIEQAYRNRFAPWMDPNRCRCLSPAPGRSVHEIDVEQGWQAVEELSEEVVPAK
jgi:heptosyltransferase-2